MFKLLLWKKFALIVLLLIIVYCSLFIVDLFRADTAFNNGEKFSRYGLYEVATEYYRKATSLNSGEPRYHRELARALSNLGKIEEAEREAEIAYTLNPKNSLTIRSLISTYNDLADINPQYQTRTEELIAEAVAWQPTNPQLYYEQSLILLKANKNEEAVEALRKALELKPDYQTAKDLLESFRQSLH